MMPSPEEPAAWGGLSPVSLLPAGGSRAIAPSSAETAAASAATGVPGDPRSPNSRGVAGVPRRVRC
eukprot:5148975-Alexandrium_andersonii.AAC.1